MIQRGKTRFKFLNHFLYCSYPGSFKIHIGISQNRIDTAQISLHIIDYGFKTFICKLRIYNPKKRIDLIHRPDRFNADIILAEFFAIGK